MSARTGPDDTGAARVAAIPGTTAADMLSRPLYDSINLSLIAGHRAQMQLAEVKRIVYRYAAVTTVVDVKHSFRDLLNDLARALDLNADDSDRHLAELREAESGICTATIRDYDGTVHRCTQPAGHYDETRRPRDMGGPRGWHHSDGHTWSDREERAVPNRPPAASPPADPNPKDPR